MGSFRPEGKEKYHIIELETEDDTDEVEFAQYVGTEAMIPAVAFGEMWAKEAFETDSYEDVKIKASVVSRDGLGGFLIYCSELEEFEQYETTNTLNLTRLGAHWLGSVPL